MWKTMFGACLILAMPVWAQKEASTHPEPVLSGAAAAVSNPVGEPSGGMIDVPAGKLGDLIKFAGKFHVVIVHFPIALILAAFLAEVLNRMTKRPFFANAALYTIVLSALSVLAVVPLGWAAGAGEDYAGDYRTVFWYHAVLGSVTGMLALGSAALAVWAAQGGRPKVRTAYLITLTAAALAVSLTGHLGAMLVQGLDYFK